MIVGENSRLSRCLTESDAADRRIAELDNDLRLAREGLAEQHGHKGSFAAYRITEKGRALVQRTSR